jgi:hypothetical protein
MTNWNARTQAILTADDFEARVSALMGEAIRAGDHEQVRVCEIALGTGEAGCNAPDRERSVARDECARVLAAAEAQQ